MPAVGPPSAESFASFAGLFADKTRATFCLTLLDRRAWTASELATHSRVSKSSVTEHLNKLVAAGILTEVRQGKHRYVRLEDPRIAELVESLATFVDRDQTEPSSYKSVTRNQALSEARTCYDHLAGALGVNLMTAMVAKGFISLDKGLHLTSVGEQNLERAGIEVPQKTSRPLLRTCLDWTERKYHLAGALGGAICSQALSNGWVIPTPQSRALRITPLGESEMSQIFGLQIKQTPDGQPHAIFPHMVAGQTTTI